MKKVFILLIICTTLWLCSCQSQSSEKQFYKDELSAIEISDFEICNISYNNEIFLKEHTIPKVYIDNNNSPYFRSVSDTPIIMLYFADMGDKIYYLFHYDIWTTMTTRLDLYCLDKESGKYNKTDSIVSENQKLVLSFTTSSDSLYWSTLDTDGKWEIIEYSLSDNKYEVLLSGAVDNNDRIPAINYSDGCLSWYSVTKENTVELVSFDLQTKTTSVIADNVISNNPYERTAGTCYAIGQDSAVIISDEIIFDTATDPQLFSLIDANEDLILWSENDPLNSEKTLWLYSKKSNLLFKYGVINYMGAGIIDSYLYVNTSDGNIDLIDTNVGKIYRTGGFGSSWAYAFKSFSSIGIESDNIINVITIK